MKDIDKNERPKEVQEETEIHGKPGKIYFMNYKRLDFREVKPMRKSVFKINLYFIKNKEIHTIYF